MQPSSSGKASSSFFLLRPFTDSALMRSTPTRSNVSIEPRADLQPVRLSCMLHPLMMLRHSCSSGHRRPLSWLGVSGPGL